VSLPEYLGLIAAAFTVTAFAIPEDRATFTQPSSPPRRAQGSFEMGLLLGISAVIVAVVQAL
jgi:hypothetical protein